MNDKLLRSYYLEIREARTFGLQRVNIVKLFTPQRVLNDSFTTGEHDHDEKLSQAFIFRGLRPHTIVVINTLYSTK